MAKQIVNLPAFLGNDYAYLKYARTIHTFLASCGWVCTSTSLTSLGQNIFDRPTARSNKYYLGWLASITPELAFNNSTSDTAIDTTNGLPTSSDPLDFVYDFGTSGNGATDVTHVVDSYKVYFDSYAGDPSAWVFSTSVDGTTWTDIDTQTAQSAPGGSAGYQTYTIATPGSATRYIRWRFTDNQDQSAKFRIREIQALNGSAVLTNIPNSSLLSPAFTRNTWSYEETWTPGDSLQSTNPFAVKIWYGAQVGSNYDTSSNGQGMYVPAMLIQMSAPNVYNSTTSQWSLGTSDNNDTGKNRYNADYTNNDPTSGRRWLMRGDSSSFVIAAMADTSFGLGGGYGSPRWTLSVERLRDNTGAFVGDGLSVIASGGNMNSVVVPTYGVYQGAESSYPCLMNTTGATTGLLADANGTQRVYLMYQTPFYKFSRPGLLNLAQYYNNDLTPDVPFSATAYNANHTYYPLGQGWFNMYRGTAAATISLAIRWDD